MALPTITKIQKTAQEMLNKYQQQQAASTTATQSGSTATPTTTATPKVTSTPKAQPSVTQPTVTSQIVSNPTKPVDLTKINLFKPQETVKTTQQIRQQYGDLMAKQQDKKDVQAGPIPGSVINAANAVGGETQTQVKKTVLQQFKDWFKRTDEKMQKSSEQFREKAWEDYYVGDFWKNLIRGETQAEEYIARLTDKLAGEGNEGYVEAFEKGQGEFWRQEIDSYNKYVEAAKAGDISSQEFGKKVGEFMNKLSGGKLSGEGWAELASSTASTLKDPRQFVGNLGNMFPWLVLSQAGGLGLGMAYGTAQQSEDVYEDFSTDEGITNNLNDNQIFLMSSGVGAVLSLVEGLGDILGDLPWAKTFSKNIRGTIGKILKKDVSKTLVKDIEDSLERDIKKEFKNPIKNAISKWFKGGLGEFAEEPIQNEIQNEVAIGAGSNRQHYTLAQLATMGIVSFVYGSALQTIGLPVNIKQNQDLKNSYKEWSNEVDKVAPGLKEEVKENMFASLVAAQIRDTQLSDKKLNRYQKQAEDLYNQKAELESQLENTTDPRVKQTINNQIKDIDTKINDIDQKVNQWQNTADEINKQLEEISSKSELLVQQPMPQQQGGENLSQQTMSMTPVQKEISKIEKKESKRESVDVLSNEFVQNEMPNLLNKYGKGVDNKSAQWLADSFDDDSLYYLKAYLNFEKNNVPVAERGKYENLLSNVRTAEKIGIQTRENLKGLRRQDIANADSFNDFLDRTTKAGVNGHLDDFVLTELNNGLHILGLKGVNVKSTEGKITNETAKRFSMMIARMSQTFGIDFNKVVNGIIFELTETEGKEMGQVDQDYEGFGGYLTQVYPKEVLEQLRDVTGYDLDNRPLLKAEYGLLRAGIALAIDGTEQYAAPILAHEFIHLLELKKALDDGLELHVEHFDNIGHVAWQAVLEGENSWKTFNIDKGTSQYRIDYLNAPSEILARYGQQYYAYINDMAEFNRLTKEEGFWSKDSFDKLIDKFESVMEYEFGAYELDNGNKNYADIMESLDNNKLYEDESWLRNFKESGQEMTDRIKNKMIEMQKEYLDLKRKIDGLEGDIAEEIKNGYRMTISMLESNIAMLSKMGPDYIKIETNTKEQQKQFDEGVNNISDNGPELISEVENNQQDGEIVDNTMKEEIDNNKEPITTGPLDVAVAKTVDKVITTAYGVINKDVKEKPVNEQKAAKEKMKSIRDVGQGIKDVFTPALSRLYSISPRLAGAVHVYEASVGLKTLGYKRLSENFVKELDKLKKKNPEAYKKLSLALFDWGMDESIDIKQSLKDAGLDEKLFEPVVSVLNQIATDYQSAGLDITINDKYFPRKVKDYGLLLDYLSRKSGTNIEDTRGTILKQIDDINNDPNLSEGEKEKKVHDLLVNNFTKPAERSNNAKERKLVLSEWLLTDEERKQGYVNDIIDFYEDPIVSLSNYIDDMVKKTELKKMLGGLTNDKTAISEKFDDSIAKIILDMEARGELTKEKAEEAKKVIKSIVNARATGKGAQRIKNLTYSMTIANRLSAAQQLEDLSKTLLRGTSGLKNIVKSVVGKANIGMDDTGIDNIFAELEGGKNITDLLFKLSGFDAVDSLGKKSFINTAWDSCVKQANSDKRSIILKTRLIEMYGEEMGNSIFESYKSGELRDKNKQLKLDVMVDLMYQLGNTQPIYRSAMPTAYLNNPKIRVVYCLWSFTLKQVDRVIQGTKQVYNNQRLLGKSKAIARTAATLRCTGALTVVSIISALVQEFINFGKGDEDDLMFKKLREEGFGTFLKQFGINSLSGLLKIFNISKYDQYIFDREGLDAVFINKITPAWLNIPGDIIQVLVGKDKVSEIGKYTPLFLKLLYYQFKNRDMLPDYKLWGGGTSVKPKFGKNGGGGTEVKFGKY